MQQVKSPRAQVELIGCVIGSAPSAPHSPLTCAGARRNGVNKISKSPTAVAKGAGCRASHARLGRVDDGERKNNKRADDLFAPTRNIKAALGAEARFVEKYPVSGFVWEKERERAKLLANICYAVTKSECMYLFCLNNNACL